MSNFIFGDWNKGGKNGRRSLNDRRLVEILSHEEDKIDQYYEFRSGDIVAKCDIESICLLNEYHWNLNHKHVSTCISCNGKYVTLSFAILVLDSPDGNVGHINKDPLDNRKENLKIIKYQKNEKMDFVAEPINKEQIRDSLSSKEKGEWQMGKIIGGSIYKHSNCQSWMVAFRDPYIHQSFNFAKYGGELQAKNEAQKFHLEEAIKRDLVYNRYRIITHLDRSEYLEVQAKDKNKEIMSFFCDLQDLDLVKKHKWIVIRRETLSRFDVITSIKRVTKRFHILLGLYKVTDHISGDPLNNRRCNLRDGTLVNSRNLKKGTNNKSGVTGVCFDKSSNAWLVQWRESGKKRKKSFTVGKQRTNEEVFELAKQFRQDIDEKLNINVQQYL